MRFWMNSRYYSGALLRAVLRRELVCSASAVGARDAQPGFVVEQRRVVNVEAIMDDETELPKLLGDISGGNPADHQFAFVVVPVDM